MPLLNNAVNTLNLYNGLSVHSVNRPNMARTQFFFIDRASRIRGCERLPIAWRVTADIAQARHVLTCRWIVDATGRSAWFLRRHCAPPVKTDRLLGVMAQVEPQLDSDRRLAVEALPEGWAYLAPLPNGRAAVGIMTDSDLLGRSSSARQFCLRQLRRSSIVAPCIRLDTILRVQTIDAASQYAYRSAGNGWIAVGDAAATCDPLSGKGICWALESGNDGGTAVIAAEAGDPEALSRYQDKLNSVIGDRLATQAQYYGLVTHWRRWPFWRRRLHHDRLGRRRT